MQLLLSMPGDLLFYGFVAVLFLAAAWLIRRLLKNRELRKELERSKKEQEKMNNDFI